MYAFLNAAASTLLSADLGKPLEGMDVTTGQKYLGVDKAFSMGGLTAAIGMCVVFVALILLVLIIAIMARVLRERKRHPSVPVAAPIHEIAQGEPIVVNESVPSAGVEDDAEIVAVIAAALAMLDAQQPTERRTGFIVRSIRRVGATAPVWGRAARSDALQSQP